MNGAGWIEYDEGPILIDAGPILNVASYFGNVANCIGAITDEVANQPAKYGRSSSHGCRVFRRPRCAGVEWSTRAAT